MFLILFLFILYTGHVTALLLNGCQQDNERGFVWFCGVDIYLRAEEHCVWTFETWRLVYSNFLGSQPYWNQVKVNISQTCSLHSDVDGIELDYEDRAGGRNVGINQIVEGIIIWQAKY